MLSKVYRPNPHWGRDKIPANPRPLMLIEDEFACLVVPEMCGYSLFAFYRVTLEAISVSGTRPVFRPNAALTNRTTGGRNWLRIKLPAPAVERKFPTAAFSTFRRSKARSSQTWNSPSPRTIAPLTYVSRTKRRSPSIFNRVSKSRLYWLTGKPEITNCLNDGKPFSANCEEKEKPQVSAWGFDSSCRAGTRRTCTCHNIPCRIPFYLGGGNSVSINSAEDHLLEILKSIQSGRLRQLFERHQQAVLQFLAAQHKTPVSPEASASALSEHVHLLATSPSSGHRSQSRVGDGGPSANGYSAEQDLKWLDAVLSSWDQD